MIWMALLQLEVAVPLYCSICTEINQPIQFASSSRRDSTQLISKKVLFYNQALKARTAFPLTIPHIPHRQPTPAELARSYKASKPSKSRRSPHILFRQQLMQSDQSPE
jgi:hypothetical protein